MRPPLQPSLFVMDVPQEHPPPGRPPAPKGSVYAILMVTHAIKIGWTGDHPTHRLRQLRHVGGKELLAWAAGTLADEARLHQYLAAWRIGRTEDFWPSAQVWSIVNLLADGLMPEGMFSGIASFGGRQCCMGPACWAKRHLPPASRDVPCEHYFVRETITEAVGRLAVREWEELAAASTA